MADPHPERARAGAASILSLRFGSGQLGFVLAYALISLLLLLAVLAATERDEPLARALSRGPLPALGKVSYGLYLYHPMVFAGLDPVLSDVLARSWTSWCIEGVLGFAISCAVATASYQWIERWFLARKAFFESPRGEAGPPAGRTEMLDAPR